MSKISSCLAFLIVFLHFCCIKSWVYWIAEASFWVLTSDNSFWWTRPTCWFADCLHKNSWPQIVHLVPWTSCWYHLQFSMCLLIDCLLKISWQISHSIFFFFTNLSRFSFSCARNEIKKINNLKPNCHCSSISEVRKTANILKSLWRVNIRH